MTRDLRDVYMGRVRSYLPRMQPVAVNPPTLSLSVSLSVSLCLSLFVSFSLSVVE